MSACPVVRPSTPMHPMPILPTQARLAIQSIAIQELIKLLDPDKKHNFEQSLRIQVEQLFPQGTLPSEDVDAAVAGELAVLMAACREKK